VKWIGQNIYSFISRFRSDVYLEASVNPSADVDKFLVQGTDGKVGFRTGAEVLSDIGGSSTDGDITSVVAGVGLSGGATAGAATLTLDLSELSTVTPANGDFLAALDSDGSTEQKTELRALATLFAGTGLSQASSVISVDVSQPTITTLAGVSAIGSAGTPITVTSDAVTFTSASADDPLIKIQNTTDNDQGARVFLWKARTDGVIQPGEADDEIGALYFYGYDSAANLQGYGRIETFIDVATHGQESGIMNIGVASHDGGFNDGLYMKGGSVDTEVDVTVASGASSVTTIAGTLTMGSTAAMTNAGLLAVANQSSITGLGTISSGVWNGTAIATAYIADDAVTFAKASGVSPKVFGSTIKILPSDFMANDEGGTTKTVQFVDNDASGLKPGNANTELLAFVSIPEGMKITLVDVFASAARAVDVIAMDVNASVDDISSASIGTGNCNTQINVTDTDSTATNFFMIQVTTTGTSDRVFGAIVTIAAQ